jgi:probable HAF family extracellular repeat protein
MLSRIKKSVSWIRDRGPIKPHHLPFLLHHLGALVLALALGAGILVVADVHPWAQTTQQAQSAYVVKDLIDIKPVLGDTDIYAEDLNNQGQAVGYSAYEFEDETTYVYNEQAFLYENGVTKDLGKLPEVTEENAAASGVNRSGDVIGGAIGTDGNYKAFRWPYGGPIEPLDMLSGHTESYATDINDRRKVVGGSGIDDPEDSSSEEHAFLYENGTTKDIGTPVESRLNGGGGSSAIAINNSAQVVGWAQNGEDYVKGWLYDNRNRSVKDLGEISGDWGQTISMGLWPSDINDLGDVAGGWVYAQKEGYGGLGKAFLYKDGQMKDLDTLSNYYDDMYVGGLNDTGQIVGTANNSTDGSGTAVLYDSGRWTDLNSLISSDSRYEGWHLYSANAITNKDAQTNQVQIAGGANVNGEDHSYILTLEVQQDTTAPTVDSTIPNNGDRGLSINTDVRATFSEAVDPATVRFDTVQIHPTSSRNETLSATAALSPDDPKTVILTPSEHLSQKTKYTVRITGGASGVKDLAGNVLVKDYTWTFTTESP